jgi:membrane-associated protein
MELFSITDLLTTAGTIGIFSVVFLESGVPFGVFLPGDGLLFTAGILSSKGIIVSIIPLCITITVGAFLGAQFGYWTGKMYGPRIFANEHGRIFKKAHLTATEKFFEHHGTRALIYCRFIPIVRTLTPIMAGAARMNYIEFTVYNAIGSFIWGTGLTALGYYLGAQFREIEIYLVPILIVIIFVSFLPVIREWYKHHLRNKIKKIGL